MMNNGRQRDLHDEAGRRVDDAGQYAVAGRTETLKPDIDGNGRVLGIASCGVAVGRRPAARWRSSHGYGGPMTC